MATYTLVQAIAANDNMNMVGDGVGNLYVISYWTSGIIIRVYKYNIGSDVLTDISAATFAGKVAGSDGELVIAWFKGNLYVGVGEGGAVEEFQIYRWNGGTSWTQVDNQSNGGAIATLSPYMDADSTRLVYSFFASGSGTRICRGSTDGTSWADLVLTQTRGARVHYSAHQGELVVHCTTGVNTDIDHCCWSALNPSTFSGRYYAGTCDSKSIWKNSSGLGLNYSTNWGTAVTAIAGNWYVSTKPCVEELNEDVALISSNSNVDQVRFWNSGTLTFDLDGTPSAGVFLKPRPCEYNGYLYVLGSTTGIYGRDNPIGPATQAAYSIGSFSPMSMDVGPDDYYLYVGAIFGGNPVLLRLLADLTADPIGVYDPGAGSAIGVRCGRVNAAWVWIAGDFGGGIKVRNSIDDGSTWTTKDPGTWNGVALPLVLGPNDDNLVLVPTDGDDDLFETRDGGLTWATLNDALPVDVGGMDRLDINLDEIIFGSDAGRDIRYTPNNGVSLHDLTDVSMDNVAITDVIVG